MIIKEVPENKLYWAKDFPDVKIPTKRPEDSDYDIYAYFDEAYIVIPPHKNKIIPTGLRVAMNKKWRLKLEERGSTGTKTIIQQSGVIDSGYRGLIGVPITNGNDKPIIIAKKDFLDTIPGDIMKEIAIIYPYEKAICQAKLDEVPEVESEEILSSVLQTIPSERGEGKLGSSGK